MECKLAQTWLFLKIDEELSPENAKELDSHLSGCPSCSRESKILALPRQIGHALPAFEPSPYFYARLKARIESESQGVTIWQIILGLSRRVVPAMAAITLTLLSVFAYFQLRGPNMNVYQAYDRIFMSGDRAHRMVIADQVEITDESVLLAISEPIGEK